MSLEKPPVPVLAFIWEHYSQYHMDRCRAVTADLADQAEVLGIEIASTSAIYAGWGVSGEGTDFRKITLFPGAAADDVSGFARFKALFRAVRKERVSDLFIAGYEHPYCFALAVLARISGRSVYVMLDSKFDDKPRRLRLELLKRLLMLPYHGAFAAGRRTAEYLHLLGFHRRPVVTGYDTVSIARLRAFPLDPPPVWEERPFLAVARLVPKKNLSLALQAYARWRQRFPDARRRLRLCGSGPLEADLRAEADSLGIGKDVDFLGFQPQEAIAREMAGACCLMLPSHEEQWGLVVNEALAFGLPVLASINAGAVDDLVTPLRNGFALDPRDVEAWADAMAALGSDPAMWQRLSTGAREAAPLGDSPVFVAGVRALVGLASGGGA